MDSVKAADWGNGKQYPDYPEIYVDKYRIYIGN
jgi:hypothetical protein